MSSVAVRSIELESNSNDLLNLELRLIEASKLTKLSAIIDTVEGWRKLIEELTRPLTKQNDKSEFSARLNLTLEAIKLIEKQLSCGKSPTLALLNHWAITGRRRPTIGTLLNVLHSCNLKWAEDFVCQSILGIESIGQLPFFNLKPNTVPEQDKQGTLSRAIRAGYHKSELYHARNNTQKAINARDCATFQIPDSFKFDHLEELVESLENNCALYSFEEIYKSTNRFCHKIYDPINQTGTKIGEGRFSSVYRAKTFLVGSGSDEQQVVAAKLLKSECNRKYLINEINLIGKVQHENILKLLGISLGSSKANESKNYICLIYQYMVNGSLLDSLSLGLPNNNMEFLTSEQRFSIALKVARGIAYLHKHPEGPIIHRDIKTANILIDANLEPKIGDFTLIRQLDSIRNADTQFSQNVIGTSVYMPPEAFRGDISIKFDSFSYGIVVLELLTGMRPFNEEQDEDLLTYISEKLSDIDDEHNIEEILTLEEGRNKFLSEILDKKAGDWNFPRAKQLFELSINTTESRKKDRPKISNILSTLEVICSV